MMLLHRCEEYCVSCDAEHTWRVCDWAKHGWLRSIVPSKDTQDLWASHQKKVKNPPWKTKGDFLPLICYTFEIIGKICCKKVFVSDKDFLLQQAIFPSKFAKWLTKVTFCTFKQRYSAQVWAPKTVAWFYFASWIFSNYLLDKMLTM